jgi:hypothetical protein
LVVGLLSDICDSTVPSLATIEQFSLLTRSRLDA